MSGVEQHVDAAANLVDFSTCANDLRDLHNELVYASWFEAARLYRRYKEVIPKIKGETNASWMRRAADICDWVSRYVTLMK